MDKVVSDFLCGGDYEESLQTTKSHLEALIIHRDLPTNAHLLAANLIDAIGKRQVSRAIEERLAIRDAILKLHLVAVRRQFLESTNSGLFYGDPLEIDVQGSVKVGRVG
jgi:hypothetical protein